ncbi:MAG: DNA repair protein RadC [Candidatus Woesearchaeota archaeon]
MYIKELPASERPRERLLRQGAGALSDAELLAIILRTGTRYQNVVLLAQQILAKYNLQALSQAGLGQLKEFKGIDFAKGCQILACFELGRRLAGFSSAKKSQVDTSKDVVKLLMQEMRFLKKENFVALYLDSRNCLIKKEIVSIGGLNSSVVHPREIFNVAISESANSIVLAHNHPSGNPLPSKDDLTVTKKVVEAGRIVGIPVLDHVVFGKNSWVSMAEQGLVKF